MSRLRRMWQERGPFPLKCRSRETSSPRSTSGAMGWSSQVSLMRHFLRMDGKMARCTGWSPARLRRQRGRRCGSKATEAKWNSLSVTPNFVTFHGFLDGSGGAHLALPAVGPMEPRRRRIEFFGDSITAGFCNLCTFASSGQTGALLESYSHSWANIVCDGFAADCHTTAWSGYGIVENCCGGTTTLPMIWQRSLATLSNSSWDFASWAPDVVVLNVGTNDRLGQRTENIARFNATLLNIVERASANYGRSTAFMLACGPMDEHYCASVGGSSIKRRARTSRLASWITPYLWHVWRTLCGHPSTAVDAAMAKGTADAIRAFMGW